jgi:hypothetical protein
MDGVSSIEREREREKELELGSNSIVVNIATVCDMLFFTLK